MQGSSGNILFSGGAGRGECSQQLHHVLVEIVEPDPAGDREVVLG